MVIHDLHVVGVIVLPAETDPPLIIDPDAVPVLAVACKRLEPVPGRHPEIPQRHCRIQQIKYPLRLPLDILRDFPGAFPPEIFSVSRHLKDLIMG